MNTPAIQSLPCNAGIGLWAPLHTLLRVREHYPVSLHGVGFGRTARSDAYTSGHPLEEVWDLYEYALQQIGPHPTLIEWDSSTPALDIGRLASIPAGQYADLVLETHPAVHVMRSRYPVAAIWHAHQNGGVDDFQINWERAAYTILISRQHDAVVVSELTEAEGVWLQNIQQGTPLGNATDAIAQCYPEFNLESALLKFVAQGVITDFTWGSRS